jgi:DNA polymerase beta
MNQQIINNFQLLIQQYIDEKPSNFQFKIKTCNKLISIIKDLDYEINSSEQLINIKGIGKKTLDKIDEIINSDTKFLKEIKNTDNSIEKKILFNKELQKLKNITGIGPAKAKILIEKNFTLEILLEAFKKNNKEILSNLTHHQLLGLKYYKDLEYKIPREIIHKFNYILKEIFPNFNYKICGSFRRGKNESGDIDLLFSFNDNYQELNLETIINKLIDENIIVDSLTNKGETKFMGFAKLDYYKYAMRIDIRIVPEESFPFAVLYFTGSKKNNTYMRNIAIQKGLKLSEYNLSDKNGKSIKGLNSEKDIFEYLNLEYIEPMER